MKGSFFRIAARMLMVAAFAAGFASCSKDDDESGNEGQTPTNGEQTTPNNGGANKFAYVDLGLPSGTLWATCNIGATKPEEYGKNFDWGETKAGVESKWVGKEFAFLLNNGVIDRNGNLTAQYDAATANLGKEWRMPTAKEYDELQTLPQEWTERNGVEGIEFKGENGATLFFPAYPSNQSFKSSSYWSATAMDDLEPLYDADGDMYDCGRQIYYMDVFYMELFGEVYKMAGGDYRSVCRELNGYNSSDYFVRAVMK